MSSTVVIGTSTPSPGLPVIYSEAGGNLRGALSYYNFGRSSMNASLTDKTLASNILNFCATASGKLIVPLGYKLDVYQLVASCPTSLGNTGVVTFYIFTDVTTPLTMADKSGSFPAFTLTGTGVVDKHASIAPTSSPYTVDATAARVMVDLRVTTDANTGAAMTFEAAIVGCMYKP